MSEVKYEFKSNSHKSKEQQAVREHEKLAPVVSGSAKTKKRSMPSKLVNIFFPGDVKSVKQSVVQDVVIPTVKNIMLDSLEMILFPEGRVGKRGKGGGTRVSYGSYYEKGEKAIKAVKNRMDVFDYDDVEFETRGDADAVLFALDDVIERYGFASVGEFYDLSQVTTTNYAVNKYGWTDLKDASVVSIRGGGWMIRFPRPEPL